MSIKNIFDPHVSARPCRLTENQHIFKSGLTCEIWKQKPKHIDAKNGDKFIKQKQSFRGAEYFVAAMKIMSTSKASLCSRSFLSELAGLKGI